MRRRGLSPLPISLEYLCSSTSCRGNVFRWVANESLDGRRHRFGSDVRFYVTQLRRRWRLVPETGSTRSTSLRRLRLPRGTQPPRPTIISINDLISLFFFSFTSHWSADRKRRAAKSTVPSTSAEAKNAPRPNRPPPTNVACIVLVSLKWFRLVFIDIMTCINRNHELIEDVAITRRRSEYFLFFLNSC